MSASGFDALSVARKLEGTGIERGQAQAIAKAVRSAAEAGDEDLVKGADLDSAAGPGVAPNRPPASSLAAFEPSLHFVDFIHALDDDTAGRRRG